MGKTLDFINNTICKPIVGTCSRFFKPKTRIEEAGKDFLMHIERQKVKSGSWSEERSIRFGPNMVHVFVTHSDGSIDQESFSKNLLTYCGQNVLSSMYRDTWQSGATLASFISSLSPTATTLTATGTVFTASNLGTVMGLAGQRVFCNAHTTTSNPTVYGNVVSNTNQVITVDQWWKYPAAANGAPVTGTTPSNGDAFVIVGPAAIQFMGLTTAGSLAATLTALTSELTTNSLGRAYCSSYTHTVSTASFQTTVLQNIFSPSGTQTGIQGMGLFVCLTAAGADPVIFVDNFASTNVLNGDTLTVTDTITISG